MRLRKPVGMRVGVAVLAFGLGVIPPSAFHQAVAAPGGTIAKSSMNRKMNELPFDNKTLGDAIDYLRDVSGANIFVNWKALAEANVTRDTTINLKLYNVSLRKALNMVLAEAGSGTTLSFTIDDNVIEVTTQALADAKTYIRIYPIEDLILEIPEFAEPPGMSLQQQSNGGGGGGGGGGQGGGGGGIFQPGGTKSAEKTKTRDERAQEIIDLITSTIRPEIWTANGGTASIRFFNGSLIISAPQSVHEMIGG